MLHLIDFKKIIIVETDYRTVVNNIGGNCENSNHCKLRMSYHFIFPHTGNYGSFGSCYLQYEFGEHKTESHKKGINGGELFVS